MIRFQTLAIAAALCTLLTSGCSPTTPATNNGDFLVLPGASSPAPANTSQLSEQAAPPSDVKTTGDPASSLETSPASELANDDKLADNEQLDETDQVAQADDDKARDRALPAEPAPGRFQEQFTKPRTDLPPLQADANGVFEVTFQDLELKMPPASVYDEKTMMTDRVRELLDQKIRIIGFIHGGSTYTSRDIKQFVMVRHFDGRFGVREVVACHHILVTLDRGIDYTVKPITVEGVLKLSLYQGDDGNTWCVYALKGKAL
ncbi:hypothetical protein [Lignipirellula cremea]|uniref:Lipoprotein n=1 Tax=Lignipirellula cremea TaxID=2528010 RepID=A0A518DQN7_9BACT|nr:hypothetical protein [Lignipirellula cremea]QDU94153.1 hypothetical protein Pla8534_19410 [Lignipirellula cremea]